METNQGNNQVYTIPVLHLINSERSTFGLRHQDFTRYRHHCTSKIHRLRQALKLSHGKGREFKKLPPIDANSIKDARALQIPLFEAERAWAYSQELKELSFSQGLAGQKHHSIARLRRAVHWSSQLLTVASELVSQSRLTSQSHAEVAAYATIQRGNLAFDRDDWRTALEHLATARSLLTELAGHAATSHDEALVNSLIDEIEPQIRYCAYQIRIGQDVEAAVRHVSTPEIRERVLPSYAELLKGLKNTNVAGKASQDALEDVVWQGNKISIRNAELVDAMICVQRVTREFNAAEEKGTGATEPKPAEGKKRGKKKVAEGKMAMFDALLAALSDAEGVARRLVEDNQVALSKAHSARHETVSRDLQIAHAYVVFELLTRRIQRDLLLVGDQERRYSSQLRAAAKVRMSQIKSKEGKTSTKGTAKVAVAEHSMEAEAQRRFYPGVLKLFDSILQSINQIRELPIVEEHEDVLQTVEAKVGYFRARRCLFLSRAYCLTNQYAEALALVNRAQLYTRQAQTLHTTGVSETSPEWDHVPIKVSTLDALSAELATEEAKIKREWFAHKGVEEGSKPVLFDIAFNYVEMPFDRLLERAGRAKPVPVAVAPAVTNPGVKAVSASTGAQAKTKPTAANMQSRKEEDTEEGEERAEPQPASKGWFAGFFGGRK